MTDGAAVTPIAIRKLKRIKIPLPPSHLFDELLGCRNNKRFLAFHWSRRVQVPVLNDGSLETIGAVEPYRIWRYHPRIMVALADYNTGDADDLAEHWLLVDRKTRALYAGKVADVLVILDYQQRGVIDPLPEIKGAGDSRAVKPGDTFSSAKSFKKQMTVSIRLVHELESWLAKHIKGV